MKISRGKAEKRRVTFKVRAPSAQEVAVAGDFNNWNNRLHPLKKDEEGYWMVTLHLAPGKYEYKLLVDGGWWEGDADEKSVKNHFGTLNRLLLVPEK